MIKKKQKSFLVILSAPSGAGKTTIKDRLMETNKFFFAISYTTRLPRSSEREGVDYHFVSEEEFFLKKNSGDFIESAFVHGFYYGTTLETLNILDEGKTLLLDIDVQGYLQLKERSLEHSFDHLSIFILPPSFSSLKERLCGRQTDSSMNIDQRLANMRNELQFFGLYDYVVVNRNLDEVFAQIVAIIDSEYYKTKRWEMNVDAFYKS